MIKFKRILLNTSNKEESKLLMMYILHYTEISIKEEIGKKHIRLWINGDFKIMIYHTETSIIGNIENQANNIQP